MGYFSNEAVNVAVNNIGHAIEFGMKGLGLLLLYGIPVGIGFCIFFMFRDDAKQCCSIFRQINAYIHIIALITSAVLIAIYHIEPYRAGYTRASGVYAIFTVAITAITLLIGLACLGNMNVKRHMKKMEAQNNSSSILNERAK